jgi:hypothetical protein
MYMGNQCFLVICYFLDLNRNILFFLLAVQQLKLFNLTLNFRLNFPILYFQIFKFFINFIFYLFLSFIK